MVFLIGLRWDHRVALVAALIVAVLPPHVRESHFTLTDTPLTLLATVALWAALRAAEARTLYAAGVAGAMVGFAAAFKYNGAIAAVMPLVAALAFPPGRRLTALGTAAAASALAFLFAAPYSLLDLPHFLNGLGAMLAFYTGSRTMLEAAGIYLSHLRNWFTWPGVLPTWIGYGALALAAIGAVRLLRQTSAHAWRWAGAPLVAFALAYFWFVSHQGSLIYGRYLLPLAPMLAVALSAGLIWLADTLARRLPSLAPAVLPFVLLVVLAGPTIAAVTWDQANARPSTLDQVSRWLITRASAGDKVVMEGQPLQMPPRVALRRVGQIVEKTLDDYRADGVRYLITTSDITDAYPRRSGRSRSTGRRLVGAPGPPRTRADVCAQRLANRSVGAHPAHPASGQRRISSRAATLTTPRRTPRRRRRAAARGASHQSARRTARPPGQARRRTCRRPRG